MKNNPKLKLTNNAIIKLDKIMKEYYNEEMVILKWIIKKLIHNKNDLHIKTDAFQRYNSISGDWYIYITNKWLILDDILPLLNIKKELLNKLIIEEKKLLLEKIENVDIYLYEENKRSEDLRKLWTDNWKKTNIIFEETEKVENIKAKFFMKKMYNFLDNSNYFDISKDEYHIKHPWYIDMFDKSLKEADDYLDMINYKGSSPFYGNTLDISLYLKDITKYEKEFIDDFLWKNAKIYLSWPVIDSLSDLEEQILQYKEMFNKKEKEDKEIKKYFLDEVKEKEQLINKVKNSKKDYILEEMENVYYYISKNNSLYTLENICIESTIKKYQLDKKDKNTLEKLKTYMKISYMNYNKERI